MTAPYPDPALEALMADLVERKESLRKAPPGKDGPIERILQLSSRANDRPFTFEVGW